MGSKTIYDQHGNRIGEDIITTDRDGRTHITHYDNCNNRVGRSYETVDYRGRVYMIHEDAQGNRLARSTVEQDWWGDYYLKTGQSRYDREQSEAEQRKKETGKTRAVFQVEDDDAESIPVADLRYGIIMAGAKIFAALIGYAFVIAAGIPLAIEIWMVYLNQTGNASLGWFWAISIILIAYFPYVGILIYRRWKKKISWKGFFLAVLRWAIIGPFAYRKLVRQMKQEKLPHPGHIPVLPESKVYCRNCGRIADSSERFCKKCGSDLRNPSETHRDFFPGEES